MSTGRSHVINLRIDIAMRRADRLPARSDESDSHPTDLRPAGRAQLPPRGEVSAGSDRRSTDERTPRYQVGAPWTNTGDERLVQVCKPHERLRRWGLGYTRTT